jgi:hypothetical protein
MSFKSQLVCSLETSYNIRVTFLSLYKQRPTICQGLVCLLVVALAGCGRDRIETYRVAKETPAVNPGLPAGWKAVAPGPMQVAAFQVTGQGDETALITIVPLGGQAGSDLGNVNRWRGQLGLAEVTEAEVEKLAQPVEIAGQTGQLYDFNAEKTRMIVAVARTNDMAWFFKMMGEAGLVNQQVPAFLGYLKSFQFPSDSAGAQEQPGLPANHPPVGGTKPPLAASSPAAGGKPNWQVPAGWRETDPGSMLTAKYIVSGPENSQAAVNISSGTGAGGGLVNNVNRWRGQLGLNSLSESEIKPLVTPLDAGDGKAMLIDMSGDKSRVLAAIVPRGDQTWFYKIMGPTAVVDAEKDNFIKFVKTVQYPR